MFNKDNCSGCNQCKDQCPYGAIDNNPLTGIMEKCDFCYSSRVSKGMLPVCVQSCMGNAITFCDMNDPTSKIHKSLTDSTLKTVSSEVATNPSVFYLYNGDIEHIPLSRYEKIKIPATRRVHEAIPDNPENASHLINTSDAMCPSECGISVLVEKGVAKKIYGNPHSLVNNGSFCAKGAAGLQLTYSPHRIKTPMLRTGERGKGEWKEVSWEEAADFIADKLISIKKEYGHESVVMDSGDVTDREAYYRLFHAFGTPNTYNQGSVCDPNRKWGQGIMLGDDRPLPDIQRPVLIRDEDGELQLKKDHDIKLLMNIGANPLTATRFNYMSKGIPAARVENKCRYIVIDPSHTNSAAHADIWLPIIPGSDAAFLAAMLYYIIKNDSAVDPTKKYIDHGFINRYTEGWDEFSDSFLSFTKKIDPSNNLHYFTPEWTEERTGISVADIKRVSHLFGITKPAAIEIGMHGTAHHTNGDVTSIIMTALCLATGNMDVPGGLVFVDSQKAKKGGRTTGRAFLEKTVSRTINGIDVTGKLSELNKDLFGDFPAAWKGVLVDLPTKIRDGVKLKHGPFKDHSYAVKAFITRAGNPVITSGSTPDWIDAITQKDSSGNYLLELMVFIDTHITVSGEYADVILPEAGFLERMGTSDVYTMSPEIAIRDQVIKPLHESKTPFEIMMTLSRALINRGDTDIRESDFAAYENEEAFIDEILSEAPGFYNLGTPLPYPELPEGCLIVGTPDNPGAVWGTKTIREGDLLTVEWLRKNNGVAVWPASYYRYKKQDNSPSGLYPSTSSKKFEFSFNYLNNINNKFNTEFPTTFYWSECKWHPKNPEFSETFKEYPFQLITGRAHYSMTMTGVCPGLAETETECMKPLNDDFKYTEPNLEGGKEVHFKSGTISIPVLALNRTDGEQLGIKTGDIIALENPLNKTLQGKVYLTEEVMPGVIKTVFGPGGQNASGMQFTNNTSRYTPNINELHDPNNISPYTGMPGFGDIMVKVIKP